MKLRFLKTILCGLFVCTFLSVQSQQISHTVVQEPSFINTCQGEFEFKYDIQNTGNSNLDTLRVTLNLNLANFIYVSSPFVLEEITNNEVIFSTSNVEQDEVVTLNYAINGSCNALNEENVTTSDQISIEAIAGTQIDIETFSTNTYQVLAPNLSINLNEGENLTGVKAEEGDEIIRKYVVRNGAATQFTGVIEFTVDYADSIKSTEIHAYDELNNELFSTITDDVENQQYIIQVDIAGLDLDEAVYIEETVAIIGCLKQAINSRSNVRIGVGCDTLDVCKTILNQTFDIGIKDRPEVVVEEVLNSDGLYCGNDVTNHLVVFKNTSETIARNPEITIRTISATLSRVLVNTVSLKNSQGQEISYQIDRNTSSSIGVSQCILDNNLADNEHSRYLILTFDDIPPNDSITLEYSLLHCCSDQFDAANGRVDYGDYVAILRYFDQCLDNDYTASAVGSPRVLSLAEQTFETQVTNMVGYDANPDNVERWDTSYVCIETARFQTGIDNLQNPEIQVRIWLDTGLVYFENESLDKLPISIVNLNNLNEKWEASSVQVGMGSEYISPLETSYKANSLLVTFKLEDYDSENPEYFYQEGGKTKAELHNFLSNSRICFWVRSVCKPHDPPPFSNIVEQLYFAPFTEARCGRPDGCPILMSEVSTKIAVQCPGCEIPGWEGSGFTVRRTNLGLRDDNNNGSADFNTCPVDDPECLYPENAYDYRVSYKDTLETVFTASFADGDEIMGRTYQQLKNQGFDFNYNYLVQKFSQGEKLTPIQEVEVKVYFNDGSISTAILPQQVVLERAALDTVFLYDLSVNLLQAYETTDQPFDPDFTFSTAINYISVKSKFLVNEIPDAPDPGLLSADVDNLMFFTGTPKDITNYEAFSDAGSFSGQYENLLEEHRYWCEGYGGRFTYVSMYLLNSAIVQMENGFECNRDVFYGVNPQKYGNRFTGIDLFPFEYRPSFKTEKAIVTIPDGHIVNNARIRSTYLGGGALKSEVVFDPSPYKISDSPLRYELPLNSFYTNRNDIDHNADETNILGAGTLPTGKMVYEDNFNNIQIYFNIVPNCSDSTLETEGRLDIADFELVTSVVDGTPIVQSFNQCCSIPNNQRYGIPQSSLEAINADNLTPQISSKEINVKFQLRNNSSNADAQNVYIYAKSYSGRIELTEFNGDVLTPSNTQFISLDDIAVNVTSSELEFTGLFNCNAGPFDQDSIVFYYGWNCAGVPVTEEEVLGACFVDSIKFYFEPLETSFETDVVEVPVSIEPCGSAAYTVRITSVAPGQFEGFTGLLTLPEGVAYTESSSVLFKNAQGISTPINAIQISGNEVAFQLDEFINEDNTFGGIGNYFDIVVEVNSSCGYQPGGVLNLQMDGSPIACQELTPSNDNLSLPTYIPGIIDDISLTSGIAGAFCDDTRTLNVSINDQSPSSDQQHYIKLSLPVGVGIDFASASVSPLAIGSDTLWPISSTEDLQLDIEIYEAICNDQLSIAGELITAFSCDSNCYENVVLTFSQLISFDLDYQVNISSEETEICPGEQIIINASTSGLSGVSTYDFVWYQDGVLIPGETSSTLAATEAGSYQVEVVTCRDCKVLSNEIIIIDSENCCEIPEELLSFKYETNTFIRENTVWSGKVYIKDGVTITFADGVVLDATNVDVVFGSCGRLRFVNGAKLKAINSVFRPCDEGATWRGLEFNNSEQNSISSSTIVNAVTGINSLRSSFSLHNNEFINNHTAIKIDSRSLDFDSDITGNDFVLNDNFPEMSCINTSLVKNFIDIRNTDPIGVITQNNFVNSQSESSLEIYGINLTRAGANIHQNRFENLSRSILANRSQERELIITNNEIEVNQQIGLLKDQVYLFGSSRLVVKFNQFFNTNSYAENNESTFALRLYNVANAVVQSNGVYGFNKGVGAFFANGLEIVSNNLENNFLYGIYLQGCSNTSLKCNEIDMNNFRGTLRESGVGIFTRAGRGNLSITSNCILNTTNAIYLQRGSVSTLPELRNNFLYNYSGYGIYNQNFNGSIGGVNVPGLNTFVSNSNAIDIFSNRNIIAYNNSGIGNTNPNVSVSQNAGLGIYSNASCALNVPVFGPQNTLSTSLSCELNEVAMLYEMPNEEENLKVFFPSYDDDSGVYIYHGEGQLLLHPNPVEDVLNITLTVESLRDESVVLQLTDVSGKELGVYTVSVVSGQVKLPVAHLAPGMYLLTLKNGDELLTERFIKE